MRPIIRVENLGKQYRIGEREVAYATLRETLTRAAKAPFNRIRKVWQSGLEGLLRSDGPASRNGGLDNRFWALKDVAFEVRPGEILGVIGCNGAGKSTLLKVLSRITEPTTGQVDLYGHVGSLLEVGTGFHYELTGRENTFLNGAILGMGRREIERKFDEIVDFACIADFIDTPVKRYSSGMYLRLAFAVAAHLETEILLVDEVLAVGDVAFQKACLGKLDDVARQGRTALFVSHQMASVKSLCTRVIQLDAGTVVQNGEPQDVVSRYLRDGNLATAPERRWDEPHARPGNPEFRLVALRAMDTRGQTSGIYSSSEPIIVELEFDLQRLHSALVIGFDLINRDGVVVFKTSHNDRREREWPAVKLGRNKLQCVIPAGLLNAGTYQIAPKVGLHAIEWWLNSDPELSFDVLLDHSESPFWNAESACKFNGVIAPCLTWRDSDTTLQALGS